MIKYLAPLLALVSLSCSTVEKETADLVIYNATIYTVDSAFSKANAMVVKDGKVLKTGDWKELEGLYESIQKLDAKGSYVYPGFIDAHCHFVGYAKGLKEVNLFGTKSFDEVLQRVVDFRKKEDKLQFISGRGWDQNDWELKEFPNRARLDELFPETPVVLTRVDGHASLVNKAALDYFNIRDTAIEGGLLELNVEGELSGILIDNAMDLAKVPDLPKSVMIESLKKAENNCFAYGLTTLDDAGLDRQSVELLDSLQQTGDIKMRLYVMISDQPELQDYYLKKGKTKTPMLNINSFKFYADGALGSRGACLIHPYSDKHDHSGFLLSSLDHFKESAVKMKKHGWQMNTHAIGDSANRVMLQLYGKYGKGKRWRIEHAQVLDESDFELFKKFQVLPSVQPTHATSDMYWADERLGEQRINDAYAYKQLLDQYGKIALGTDFPVEDISTVKTFYAATVRKDIEGYPENGFQMENALSREEALKGMTIWAAYANFEEKEKGSLEPGKYADFVILDKDWVNCEANEILNTQVLYTFIGGEEVYRK